MDLWRKVFADQPQHPDIRNAADWLIACILVRARAGEDRGGREARAKQLCHEFGFDFAKAQAKALQFPDQSDD
jgi:hypothetical protein